jgi:hypothetical protein
MGVSSAELWNNLGLSCFYAAQFDMALNCFDRALSLASDDCMADIWSLPPPYLLFPLRFRSVSHSRVQVQHRSHWRGSW